MSEILEYEKEKKKTIFNEKRNYLCTFKLNQAIFYTLVLLKNIYISMHF